MLEVEQGDSGPLIGLDRSQVMALLDADWLGEGPIRLNVDLTLDDLADSLVLPNARIVMGHMAADEGVGLTASGNFKRSFVKQMTQEFRWPGFGRERVYDLNMVLNEPDFLPLHFIHVLIKLARLGRKHKGRLRLSRAGRSLLAPERAGDLNAVLFDATFRKYNLAYLDRFQADDSFQPQIGLTLYLMSRIAQSPRSPDELVTAATFPIESVGSGFLFRPEDLFRTRVLRYLEWFGLIESLPMAANDDVREHKLFRKTPLYDRILTFDLEPEPR